MDTLHIPLGRPAPQPARVALALLAVQVLFGINYVVSKVILQHFHPLVWASLRIIVSTALLFAVCALTRAKLRPTLDRKFMFTVMGLSLLGCIINQGSFLVGLKLTTPTNSAILNTTIPIFTLLIVTIRGQEPLSTAKVAGLACSLAGVLMLRKIEDFKFSDSTMVGDLLTLLNCLSFALFLSVGKKFLERHDRMWITAFMFLFGSVGLSGLAAPYYSDLVMPDWTPSLAACAVYAIIGGTLLTYFLNNWALAYAKSSQVALWIYVQPVVAAILAWAWLGQAITPRTVFSALFVFFGVLLSMNPDKIFARGIFKRSA